MAIQSSPPVNGTPNSGLRIHVYGHSSAHPEQIAAQFGGTTSPVEPGECDLAIFAINPATGIAAETIAAWEHLNEFMVPRLIVVTGLDNSQADFDDAVLLANRVFDATLTPFLVLHDENGMPCALISLKDLQTFDYTFSPPKISPSSEEHRTLVEEFRNEYLAGLEVMGEDGFAAGMLFPAIPVWIEKGIGVDIVESYIAQLAN